MRTTTKKNVPFIILLEINSVIIYVEFLKSLTEYKFVGNMC